MMRFTSRARLVPLPLVEPPVWHGSSSRRVRLRYNRACAVTRRANAAIKAVNSLSMCLRPSRGAVFERAASERPGSISYSNVNSNSLSQTRLVSQIYLSAGAYVSRLVSSLEGPLCDDMAEPGQKGF